MKHSRRHEGAPRSARTVIALWVLAVAIASSGAGCDMERKTEPAADAAEPTRAAAPAAAGASAATPDGLQAAYFAGGCFWGIEHYFQKGPGVVGAASGYMQGRTSNPTYEDVVTDTTGHAETVKVVFDPKKISYRRLLEAFFVMHDPTQLNRQGPDVGEQYRSGIFYADEGQKREAEAYIKELASSGRYRGKPIVTQVEPAKKFFPAEDYHQDYVAKTGRPCHVKDPW